MLPFLSHDIATDNCHVERLLYCLVFLHNLFLTETLQSAKFEDTFGVNILDKQNNNAFCNIPEKQVRISLVNYTVLFMFHRHRQRQC